MIYTTKDQTKLLKSYEEYLKINPAQHLIFANEVQDKFIPYAKFFIGLLTKEQVHYLLNFESRPFDLADIDISDNEKSGSKIDEDSKIKIHDANHFIDLFCSNAIVLANGSLPDVYEDVLKDIYHGIDWSLLETHLTKLPYFSLANSSTTHVAKSILNNPTRVVSTRKGQITKNEHYLTKDSTVTYKGNDSTLTFTIERTRELFSKRIQNGAKVFNFLLQKLNEQNFREHTTFQLSEIVDNGIYANKDSAYRGLKNVLDKMGAISIEGIVTEYEGRKKKEVRNVKARLVAQRDISYNSCTVVLPPIIRERFTYITILPRWSYLLNENSYMLIDYIFYLARQNTEKIKEQGYFTVSLDAVRAKLGLPEPEEVHTGNYIQRIIEPIEKAITEIEEAQEGAEVKITPCFKKAYTNIYEYLEGYLKIELDSIAMEYMEKRAIEIEEKRIHSMKLLEKSKPKTIPEKTDK